MAQHHEVLGFLRPNGGYVSVGENYEGITFEATCEPFTEKEYLDGFAQYDAWKSEQEAKIAASKQAILDRLGITAEEAKLLLS